MGRVNMKTDKVYPVDYMFQKVEELKQIIDNDVIEINTKLADISTVNNHSITYTYYSDGNVQTVTEKDGGDTVIKTTTYIYNASGDVTSSATVMDGKTVTTTYNYDANGNITSTSNVIT